jgi:hypothetical protein
MTANELRQHFNYIFGLDAAWPLTYEVDAETYANVCQELFDFKVATLEVQGTTYPNVIDILVGRSNGLMFKNVELILNNDIYYKDEIQSFSKKKND